MSGRVKVGCNPCHYLVHKTLRCGCRSLADRQRGYLSIAAIASLLLLILATSCQQTQLTPTKPVTISIAGATAMRPVLEDLSREFSRQHPHSLFEISGGNSTTGEERLRQGEVDLAASTLISASISSELLTEQQHKPLIRIPLGLDGLAVITHKTNPVENLTLLQLQDLYNGRIWDWQELGGNNEAVLLVTREEGSGSQALFTERVMAETPIALMAVVVPTSEDVVDYVAHNEGAIGYVSRAYVIDLLHNEQNTVAPSTSQSTVHLIKIEDQLPTIESLETQSYFLIQPLYLVSNGQPRATVKQFVDFTLSPAGQAIVARYHSPIR